MTATTRCRCATAPQRVQQPGCACLHSVHESHPGQMESHREQHHSETGTARRRDRFGPAPCIGHSVVRHAIVHRPAAPSVGTPQWRMRRLEMNGKTQTVTRRRCRGPAEGLLAQRVAPDIVPLCRILRAGACCCRERLEWRRSVTTEINASTAEIQSEPSAGATRTARVSKPRNIEQDACRCADGVFARPGREAGWGLARVLSDEKSIPLECTRGRASP